MRPLVIALLGASLALGQSRQPKVKAEALAGHVSFLSSDALEGRRTPSKGLDAASAYIASWFRRNGLEAPIDGGYFQIAKVPARRQPVEGFKLVLENGGAALDISPTTVSGAFLNAANLEGSAIYKLEMKDANSGAELTAEDLHGKVLLIVPAEGVRPFAFVRKISAWKLPAVLILDPSPYAEGFGLPRVGLRPSGYLRLHSKEAADFAASLPAGLTTAKATVHAAAPIEGPVEARNVVGIVRGLDPVLRDSYVMVSAHYDHLGASTSGPGDPVFHGANDDASGVAAMLEIASFVAKRSPRRSVLFVAFFGEEDGLVGSRYYGKNPVVPISKIAAQLNLEQLGRTDVDGEKEIAAYNLTGFDFTTLPKALDKSADKYGVKIYKKQGNDAYFGRSDNQALADVGVPSTTISVGYEFSDYHQRTDTWEKLDYVNMAKVTSALAAGVLSISKRSEAPQWNMEHKEGKRYSDLRSK